MADPERGPWGKNPEVDRIRSQEVGLADVPFIAEMLGGFLEQLGKLARVRGITFTVERKYGLPGVLTLLQQEGDVYQLLEQAKELTKHANDLEAVQNRTIEFFVDYVKAGGKVPRSALVISGFTTRVKS